ncbi:MAG TPA: isoaspartyl peptidase/L-asparaginase [Leptolyngbyaceae cyanobacterium M33_DOE_097]|uniref:Uncharacterized protein n=1 Tax=Oscillatoriales cyanobacterium SpSt-418 TaxID=2282169 RepID=A0A7C3PQK1_9CYAN|nr:isoaspartyl peptidase/L-asparaginase [Leptolyngbyaceae cyanobacterium M33_DOE_097]
MKLLSFVKKRRLDENCAPQERVGGSASIGAGLCADNRCRTCSTTGDGESMIPVVLAKTAIDALAAGKSPDEVAQQSDREVLQRLQDGSARLDFE